MGRSRPSAVLVALLTIGVFTAGCGGADTGRSDAGVVPGPTPQSVDTTQVTVPPGPPNGPSAPDPRPDTIAAGPCTGPGLAVSLAAPTAAPDVLTQDMFFQNTGTAPCLLRGFAAVSFVAGNEGSRVGEQALPSGERGPEVRLEPRGVAVETLRIMRVATYDARVCRPVPVRGLRVAPPGGSGSVFVPREDMACSVDDPTEPQMRVDTVVAR